MTRFRAVPKMCPRYAFLPLLPDLPQRRISNLLIPNGAAKNKFPSPHQVNGRRVALICRPLLLLGLFRSFAFSLAAHLPALYSVCTPLTSHLYHGLLLLDFSPDTMPMISCPGIIEAALLPTRPGPGGCPYDKRSSKKIDAHILRSRLSTFQREPRGICGQPHEQVF